MNQVLAVDHGVPPLTSTATVVVNVIDYNDNPPMFSQLTYRAKGMYQN